MSMGGSTPAPPTPKPEIPVPQDKDIHGVEAAVEAQKRAKMAAGGGAVGHLLSGTTGLTEDPQVTKQSLVPY